MAASLEVELKLRAEDEEPLRQLATLERLGHYRLGPASEAREVDRYLDTPDGRLSAAQWACRLRSRDGRVLISLKGPAEHDAGDAIHRRPELEGPADDELAPLAWPPSAARDQLLRLAGDQPLLERLALEQQRTERAVTDGGPLGTLSLDRVRVMHAGLERGRFLAVELELMSATPDDRVADELLGELRAIDGLLPEPRSKLERALDLLPGVT
jgi:inorganic triphosphatase YgiF